MDAFGNYILGYGTYFVILFQNPMEVTDIWVKPFAVVEKALDDYRLIEILTLRPLIEYVV